MFCHIQRSVSELSDALIRAAALPSVVRCSPLWPYLDPNVQIVSLLRDPENLPQRSRTSNMPSSLQLVHPSVHQPRSCLKGRSSCRSWTTRAARLHDLLCPSAYVTRRSRCLWVCVLGRCCSSDSRVHSCVFSKLLVYDSYKSSTSVFILHSNFLNISSPSDVRLHWCSRRATGQS